MNRLITFISIACVVAAAAAGGLLGVVLGERASEPGTATLALQDPALTPDDGPVLRSPGGFTGFEGAPALSGRVFRTGTFKSLDGDAAQVISGGAILDLEFATPDRLLTLAAIDGQLVPGDIVVVRYEGDTPAGILRVPGDLRRTTTAAEDEDEGPGEE
jgi:hypothetical protein